MTRFLRHALSRLALAVGASAALLGAAQAGTLSIGHTTWVGYGPLFVARDLGYFKQAGLDEIGRAHV